MHIQIVYADACCLQVLKWYDDDLSFFLFVDLSSHPTILAISAPQPLDLFFAFLVKLPSLWQFVSPLLHFKLPIHFLISLFNNISISDIESSLKSDTWSITSCKCNNREASCQRLGSSARKAKKKTRGCGAEIARLVRWARWSSLELESATFSQENIKFS